MASCSSQGRLCGRKRRSDEAKIGRKLSDHKLNRRSDAEWLNLKPLTEGATLDSRPIIIVYKICISFISYMPNLVPHLKKKNTSV